MEPNIGKGSFGNVDHVVDKQKGTHFAIKRIQKKGVDVNYSEDNLKREIGILSKLDHDHIVKCYGYFGKEEKEEYYSIVTEWVNGRNHILLTIEDNYHPNGMIRLIIPLPYSFSLFMSRSKPMECR